MRPTIVPFRRPPSAWTTDQPESHPIHSIGGSGQSNVKALPGRWSSPPRTAPSPVRVVIVDDHPLVRSGVRLFLETDPTISVIGEANDGETGVALVRELTPDVVLMDVTMAGMDGIAATTTIKRDMPTTEVVALSSTMDPTWVKGMIRAGAVGYLAKDTGPRGLCRAIHGAAVGQVQLCPDAAAIMVQDMRDPAVESLSPRELEVVHHLVAGKTNKGIANALGIGEKTVKTHMSSIIGKLGVESRTQAALVAVEMGLVRMSSESFAS